MIAGKHGRVYVGGYDISGNANRYQASFARPLVDATTFASDGHMHKPTLGNDSVAVDVFYDEDISGTYESIRALTANTPCSVLTGVTQGVTAVSGEGKLEDYSLDVSVADLLRATTAIRYDDLARTGVLLEPKGTQTSAGESDVLDDGAASASGAYAAVHVFACDFADLVVKIQTDDNVDFTSPTDLVTFATVSGITAEWASVSGAVERYVRVSRSGTFGTAQYAVVWCRA